MMRHSESGFSLIEMAVVMIISSLILAFGIQAYLVYVQGRDYDGQSTRLATVQTTLASFETPKGRFPCPSDPSIGITDRNAGFEQCAYFAASLMPLYTGVNVVCNPAGFPFPNSQAGALCIIPGQRHTIGNPNPAGMDPVYIGAIPFKTMKAGIESFESGCPDSNHMPAQPPPPAVQYNFAVPGQIVPCSGFTVNNNATPACLVTGSNPQTLAFCDTNNDGIADAGVCPAILNANNVYICDTQASFADVALSDTLDPWGYQMSYAVAGIETNAATYGQGSYGSINVTDEQNINLLSPPNTATYVFVSHGDDHSGAYTTAGQLPFPCTTAAQGEDWYDCNNQSVFISGIRAVAPGPGHLDDMIVYTPGGGNALWAVVTMGSTNIYNKNLGFVGIGTGSTPPAQMLEINGNIQVQGGSCQSGNSTSCAYGTQICDQNGANCWSPAYIAGPAVVQPANPTSVPAGANTCPPAAAGSVNVVTGIAFGTPICTGTLSSGNAPALPLITPAAGVAQNCPAGQYLIGFGAGGLISCAPPP